MKKLSDLEKDVTVEDLKIVKVTMDQKNDLDLDCNPDCRPNCEPSALAT
jgi:hypothetical protein